MLDRPNTEGSDAVADPLSAVLRAVRLRGAIFFLVDASPPWVAEAPATRVLAPLIMPGSQHVIEYHVVTRGSCYGGLVNGQAVELRTGDVIVFPHGDAHVMSSTPDMRGDPALDAVRGSDDPGKIGELLKLTKNAPPFTLQMGGGDASARIGMGQSEVVCGFLGCDARPFNPLIAALPRVLHVRADSAPNNGYLSSLIALTMTESMHKRAGSEVVLARFSELMFIEVVRRHLLTLPPEQEGWLAGLRDPVVGRALSLLHARPAYDWTIDGLARAASSSRSALAERFKMLVGQPPMQYLAQWRMQLASGLLAEGNANVGAVASEVGYGSEAAFSRAFKKLVGVSPAAWREQQSTPASPR
jgi:AraC-like DNA-binding protein